MRISSPRTQTEYRTHLHLVHGYYVADVKTMAGLEECHQALHQDPDYHFTIRHNHFEKIDEEFTW